MTTAEDFFNVDKKKKKVLILRFYCGNYVFSAIMSDKNTMSHQCIGVHDSLCIKNKEKDFKREGQGKH